MGLYLENDAAVCEITRCHKVSLIGFSWSKGVGVRDFESTDIYPFKCNKVPIILFSISDTSETKTYGNNTSKYGSHFCTLYYSTKLSGNAETNNTDEKRKKQRVTKVKEQGNG